MRQQLTTSHAVLQIIEESLGKFGIICVEDLIHEIFTAGPNFKA